MRITAWIILSFFLFSNLAFAKEPIRIILGSVTKVVDGDTIHVTDSLGTKVKVRFYGIDAPELEYINKTGKIGKQGQPFGKESYETLLSKLNGKKIRLDVMDIDRYQRVVAIVWLTNRNINHEMVSEGMAWAYRKYLDKAHPEYINAEESAQTEKKGLWVQADPQKPWEFRNKGFR